MVAVFKTNVRGIEESAALIQQLLAHFPFYTINFDLEDCDKILRMEGASVCIPTVIALLGANGYRCEELI